MKKVVLIGVCIGALGIGVVLAQWFGQPAEGEFISPDSPESRLHAVAPSPVAPSTISTNCFTLASITNVSLPKTIEAADGCVLRAALVRPKGQVTVTLLSISGKTLAEALSEHTGIAFRERDPSTYTAVEHAAEPLGQLTFHKAFSTPTEITGFFTRPSQNQIITVTIHSVARVNPEVVSSFWSIVAALQFD